MENGIKSIRYTLDEKLRQNPPHLSDLLESVPRMGAITPRCWTCPSFDIQRQNLLAGVLALVRPFGITNPSNEVLTQLLMYGDKDFPNEINRNILDLTLHFIHETGRFE